MVSERMSARFSRREDNVGQGRFFPLLKHPSDAVNVWTNGNYLNIAGERSGARNHEGGFRDYDSKVLTSYFFTNFPEDFGRK